MKPLRNATIDLRSCFLNDRDDVVLEGTLYRNGKPVDIRSDAKAVILDLNNRGEVLVSLDRDPHIWKDGTLRAIGVTYAGVLNDKGDVVGGMSMGRPRPTRRGRAPKVTHAVLWTDGMSTDLGALPTADADSEATAMNDEGQVVGLTGFDQNTAFLWDRGRMTDLGCLSGYQRAEPAAVNNKAQVAGTLIGHQNIGHAIWADAFQQPFLWRDGAMYALETPPGETKTYATDINDAGQIIGYVSPMHRERQEGISLMWEHGRMYNVNELIPRYTGWEVLRPLRINNKGEILVQAMNHGAEGLSRNHPRVALLKPNGRGDPGQRKDPLVLVEGMNTTRVGPAPPRPATTPIEPAQTTVRYDIVDPDLPVNASRVLFNNAGQIVYALNSSGSEGLVFLKHGNTTVPVHRTLKGAWLPQDLTDDGSLLVRVRGTPYIWKDGKTRDPALSGYESAMSNAGHVVGGTSNGRGAAEAYLWKDGRRTSLGTLPGETWSTAFGVNSAGHVVGVSGGRAFLWKKGRMRDLGVLPGYPSASATHINDRGQVAGVCSMPSDATYAIYSNGRSTAFLWENGVMRDLGLPMRCARVRVVALNNHGVAVGEGDLPRVSSHRNPVGIVWRDGRPLDLATLIDQRPGWVISDVCDINDSGEILVQAQKREEIGHVGVRRTTLILRPVKD